MKRTQEEGEGIVLYLGERPDGGLVSATDMHHLNGSESAGAYHRHIAARILEDLGLERARLATAEVSAEGSAIVERRGGELEVVEYLRG